MKRGHAIAGRVIDLDGRPVTGATVRIVTSDSYPPIDEITDISLGNFVTRSDVHGAYRFDGVSISELAHFSSSIIATYGDLRTSSGQRVPRADARSDFVLEDAGATDGAVHFPVEPGSTATARSGQERAHYADVGADRRFRFDNLPVGEYRISLVPGDKAVPMPTSVAVTAGTRSSLAIAAPAKTVNVTLHIAGRVGELVTLTPSDQPLLDREPVAMLRCTEAGAEVAGVTPARYNACVAADCTSIEVTDVSRQTFHLAH